MIPGLIGNGSYKMFITEQQWKYKILTLWDATQTIFRRKKDLNEFGF